MAIVNQMANATQGLDGRTRHAKRLRSLIAGLAQDIGREPSTAEQALIEQAASLIVRREALEAAIAAGEPANSAEITKMSGAVTRCLATLRGKTGGKARVAPGPTLADYLERKRAEKAASASAGDPA